MPSDGDDEKRGTRARQAPLEGTSYTDAELNARVREFPSPSEIWNEDRSDAVLLNSEQCLDVLPMDIREEKTGSEIAYGFIKLNGELIHPVVIMMRSHFLLRKYKTSVIIHRLKLTIDGDQPEGRLYGWHLSDHDRRRAVESLQALYGMDAVEFRKDACQLYDDRFGDWLSHRSASGRGPRGISSNAGLLGQLSIECSIIAVLRRVLGDAESAASEWPSILSGRHVPSLDKLHRIVNPKQDGVDSMDDDEMFTSSIIVSFFGCTNAAFIYPKMIGIEDVLRVLCFFGRINLGEIWPTVGEAKAFLRYCDIDPDDATSSVAGDILAIADKICGWMKFKSVIAEVCKKSIEADDAGLPPPCIFGRLWPMV